jgi:hypothetical protein
LPGAVVVCLTSTRDIARHPIMRHIEALRAIPRCADDCLG